jgi:Ran GTPase-activating protein (RanGAP) involved in mRNA processing and transport
LDLSDNLLQDKGAKYLCEYFMNSQTLEQLIVSNNGLTDVGALRLTDMFRVCSKLKVVGVADNEQTQKIAQACEKRGRRNNQGLQEVVYI